MSKRAEELAKEVLQINGFGIVHNDDVATVAFLIDAELRKERERAADRAIACLHRESLAGTWADTPLRAAILAEEGD